jgi:uncharacterized protein (TIGR02598 family)
MSTVFFSTNARQCDFYLLRDVRAFSLVEVVFALGVAAIAILAIISLLPIGIHSSKESLDESGAINVLSEVIADRQATPYNYASSNYDLPALNTTLTAPVTNTFGISDSNPSVTNSLNASHYLVNCVFMPPVAGSLNPYQAQIKVSWPALSTNASDFVEVIATFPQP